MNEDVTILGFADYRFHEGVPLIVLRRMENINHLFDVLEIRTPEVPQRIVSDPVLWGHVIAPDGTRAIYSLARWAESDANFISGIADLKKILRTRRGLTEDNLVKLADKLAIFASMTFVVAVMFTVIAFGLSFIWSAMPYGWIAFFAGALVGAGLSLTSICTQIRRVHALKKSDPSLVRFV